MLGGAGSRAGTPATQGTRSLGTHRNPPTSLHPDVHVGLDPYLYLKQEPFASYQLLAQNDERNYVNCGVTYWQNAAPDGPALWVVATLVDRVLR